MERMESPVEVTVTAMYCFLPLAPAELPTHADNLRAAASKLGVKGLVLLAPEGINLTVAAAPHSIHSWKELVLAEIGLEKATWKDSPSEFQPFKRFKVDLREEIVTIKKSGVAPQPAITEGLPAAKNGHLSPAEWDKFLKERSDYTLVDTRNHYEVRVGKFPQAIDPNTAHFSEFPTVLEKMNAARDKPLLMYCTGGIRCEKAAIAAQKLGFKEVYQLDGGILNYLAYHRTAGDSETRLSEFSGECFVFDNRVAVDDNLQPSKQYKLCPHCGDPGDLEITCKKCATTKKICPTCAKIPHRNSCSKNCAHHLLRSGEG